MARLNKGGVGKIGDFQVIFRYISESVQDRDIVKATMDY